MTREFTETPRLSCQILVFTHLTEKTDNEKKKNKFYLRQMWFICFPNVDKVHSKLGNLNLGKCKAQSFTPSILEFRVDKWTRCEKFVIINPK